MKFQKQQNARMFFVQWLFAYHYNDTTITRVLQLFLFTEENFDYDLLKKLEITYIQKEDIIKKFIGPQPEVINQCILIMGVCEILNGTEEALAISECLKISDLFCNNSKYINSTLEKIKTKIKSETN